MMSPKEVRQLWVEALLSGKYVQGTGRLRYTFKDVEKHCCLGVLCDLAVEHKVIPPPVINSVGEYGYGLVLDIASLPDVVRHWVGLKSSTGIWSNDRSLTQQNDRGVSFADIVKLIKEHESELCDDESARSPATLADYPTIGQVPSREGLPPTS